MEYEYVYVEFFFFEKNTNYSKSKSKYKLGLAFFFEKNIIILFLRLVTGTTRLVPAYQCTCSTSLPVQR